MKLLADLANLDVVIGDEDKVLILLSSLPDEGYGTFVLTLINGRTSLSYNEVITALVNLKLRKKDKESSGSTSAQVLAMRENSPNQRRRNQQRSNWNSMVGNRKLKKDQCAFYKERGHGKVIVQGSISRRRSHDQRPMS